MERDPIGDYKDPETPQSTMDEEPESLGPKSGHWHEDGPAQGA